MGKTDEFGNYTIHLNNTEYRINKLQWRDKRVLRGKMAKVVNAEGELDPFSEGFYDLQDWVLSKVGYVNGAAITYLNSEMIVSEHFNRLNIDELDGVDTLFNAAMEYMAENFTTPAAVLSDPQNSTADAGDSSNSQNIQSRLSGMLKE